MKNIATLLLALISVLPVQAQNEVTIALLSLNDFHGSFVQNPSQGIPGAPSILQTLDSLKRVYPYHLTLSVGDNFGGSYFYKMTKGQELPVFFDMAGIRVSALGNHEFDDGQDSLALKWSHTPLRPADWDIKYICANVLNPASAIPTYAQPFTVEHVRISPTKDVAVGITGLLANSAETQISKSRIKDMQFKGNYTHILDSVQALPDFAEVENAPIRILLMHIGVYEDKKTGEPAWNDYRTDELEKINGPLYQAFIAGHSHDRVIGRINADRKPVVQGFWQGQYIGVTRFRIDTLTMQVTAVDNELVPVPLRSSDMLTGQAARLNEITDSLLHVTTTAAGVNLGTRIGLCSRSIAHDRSDKYRLTRMGQLVCDCYATAYRSAIVKNIPADQILPAFRGEGRYARRAKVLRKTPIVGVSHFGSIRAGLTQGPLTVLDAGEVLPFSNDIYAFRVNGKHLRELIEFGYHNQKFGWIQYNALDVKLDKERRVLSMTYTGPDGRSILIKDNTPVIIICDSFMAGGGDGYPVSFFPKDKQLDVTMPGATDCFIQYIQKLGTID